MMKIQGDELADELTSSCWAFASWKTYYWYGDCELANSKLGNKNSVTTK